MNVSCIDCGELAAGFYGMADGVTYSYCAKHMPEPDATLLSIEPEPPVENELREYDNVQHNPGA